MKKNHLKKLAFKGIATAVLTTSALGAANAQASPTTTTKSSNGSSSSILKDMEDADGGNLGYHLYTEEELLLELNPEGVKLYNSLTPEGKRLARVVASSRCDHENECAGLNACKTDEHECAGKGSCKGTGKCAVADKNLAVKLVADKMAKKRANVMQKK